MLDFQRGNASHPTGNLLVYCHVRGHNPVEPGGDLIVCNVVVSYVSAKSNHFPVVIFPPTALPGFEDLEQLLELGETYDLVQLEDFEIPEGGDEDAYVKERLDSFNRYVMEYVEMCREHIQDELHKREIGAETSSSSGESSAPRERESGRRTRSRRNSAESRDGIKITRFRGDEASAIDFLEAWLEGEGPEKKKPDELNRVIRYIKNNLPRYDIHNFERILDENQSELPRLYVRKFRAIFAEEYEQAAQIQSTIRRLEKS